MENKEGKKADDAPDTLKGTEQPFPGEEAEVTESPAPCSVGG